MNFYFLTAHFLAPGKEVDSSIKVQLKNTINPSYRELFICDNYNARASFKLDINDFGYSESLSQDLANKNVKYPESWNHIGCWKWKPLIINHVLKNIPEGSLLLYHDINMQKYVEYTVNISADPLYLMSLMGEKSVLLMSQGYKPLLADSKRYLLKKYNMDSILLRYLPGFWSGCIAFVKNQNSLDFCSQWVDYVTDDNFFPLPDVESSNKFRRFIHHSSCQATLALTYYKSKNLRKSVSVAYSKSQRNIFTYKRGLHGLLKSGCIEKYIKSIFRSLLSSLYTQALGIDK